MAQWSRADRTLYTKIVYYGPAFGGKTTNLETLHRLTDPNGKTQLLSLKTAADRTLFFDLLPFDLGEILGYHVGIKLYTVPGQVRYETTRQVVLAGADALVFVADSSAGREEQNRWSLQNLKMNMRAKRLDPAKVPVHFQYNKQDLADAASPEEVARWLSIPVERGIPAVATDGTGVLETFMAASRSMLQRVLSLSDRKTQASIDPQQLNEQVERAFAPLLQRVHETPESTKINSDSAASDATLPIVFESEDLLKDSVEASVTLGEELSNATTRARRLEQEAEALRRLSDSLRLVGASFEEEQIVDAVLSSAMETLGAATVAFVRRHGERFEVERVLGRANDPLVGNPSGETLLSRLIDRSDSRIANNLDEVLSQRSPEAEDVRAVVVAPVDAAHSRALVAYAVLPELVFQPEDERFLSTLAGHLAVGLEKTRLYQRVTDTNSALEQQVQARTLELKQAYEELRQLDELKDRFLSNVSHEMKTPLTAILSSATFLRDYESSAEERKELVQSIVRSGENLQELVENLFRLSNMEKQDLALDYQDAQAETLVREAIFLSGHPVDRFKAAGHPVSLHADRARVTRALANLFDNAVKFSPDPTDIEVRVELCELAREQQTIEALAFSVSDRGEGIDEQHRDRMFKPMEQGGCLMTDKPSGLGIGLHEAKLIAERHGGELRYAPREGGGSTFCLTLPLQPAESLRSAEVSSDE